MALGAVFFWGFGVQDFRTQGLEFRGLGYPLLRTTMLMDAMASAMEAHLVPAVL